MMAELQYQLLLPGYQNLSKRRPGSVRQRPPGRLAPRFGPTPSRGADGRRAVGVRGISEAILRTNGGHAVLGSSWNTRH
jgi:hypothetical protein